MCTGRLEELLCEAWSLKTWEYGTLKDAWAKSDLKQGKFNGLGCRNSQEAINKGLRER